MISNAPLAYAIPAAGFPMALDIAMSATAGMKVRLAAERGEAIPEGWVLDRDGRPTTDPGDYANGGALAPLGGHKGYGLALLTEVLAGVLSGAGITKAIVPWLIDTATPTDAGHGFVVLDIDCFMDRSEFLARMQHLIDEMHAAEPAPGVDRVLVPGELEHHSERRALELGLDLEPVIWTRLEAVARELRIPLDIAYSAG
jgi:LDH2 family malate/lactate/ureidoglycolate dehydrogenase